MLNLMRAIAMTVIRESVALPDEFRSSTRIVVNQSARLLDLHVNLHAITIVDISMGGLGILTSEAKQVGDSCAIAFEIVLGGVSIKVSAWAKIAYCIRLSDTRFRVGVKVREHDSRSQWDFEEICAALDIGLRA
jgi:hypothetical protein